MTTHTTLSKDLSNVVSEMETYISTNSVIENSLADPFIPLVQVSGEISSLVSALADNELSIKTLNLFTVYPGEVVSSINEPYLIIPIHNSSDISLVMHDLKEGATGQTSALKYSFYMPSDTNDVAEVPLAANTVYLVNADAHHSFRYGATTFTAPFPSEDATSKIAVLLMATVNEDLSGYFS